MTSKISICENLSIFLLMRTVFTKFERNRGIYSVIQFSVPVIQNKHLNVLLVTNQY